MTNLERIKALEPFWGSWYITRLIGEGGFGAVYEIERRENNTVFRSALKVISIPAKESDLREALAGGMSEEETSDYFEDIVREMTKECALMETVKGHTNIVGYEDHMVFKRKDSIGWDILIRMELLIPLNDYLRDNPLTIEEICKLGIDICSALSVCEKKKIIHRDIKPANIFMNEMGDFKLGDFGIARISERTQGASTKIGTKDYLAPEVYKGERYGMTVDLYALGLVLYRFSNSGRLPFLPPAPQKITYNDREAAFFKRINNSGVIEKPSSCPECLFRVIEKACAYRPQHRYSNAEEMKADLVRALSQIKAVKIIPAKIEPLQDQIAGNVSPAMVKTETVDHFEVKADSLGKNNAIDEVAPIADREIVNKKKEFPVWIFFLAACICFLIVLCTSVYRIQSKKQTALAVEELQFPDLTGMSEEESDQKLKNWIESNKFNDKTIVYKEYVFNIGADNEKVIRQEPNQGAVVGNTIDKNGKVYMDENGDLSGLIRLYIESPSKLSYKELVGLNAFSLSEKMNVDIEKDPRFLVKEDENGNYYDILSIRMKDGSSKDMEEIRAQKDSVDYIDLNEIDSIVYEAGDFFYWEEFPDYVGKFLEGYGDELAVGDTFRKSGEGANDRKPSAWKIPIAGSRFIDATYYSFEKNAGEIVEQNVEAGTAKVDVTKLDEEICPDGILLRAIMPVSDEAPDGGSINATNYKGEDLKAKLVSLGFSEDSISIPGEKDTKVTQVKVTKDDLFGYDMDVEWFKVDEADSLRFEIITQKKPDPVKPAPSKPRSKRDSTPQVAVPGATPSVPQSPDPTPAEMIDID